MIKIKRITTKETYPIRQEVLRKGKPIESCYFANDDDTSTFHLGCFENEILKGIVSVYETQNLLFPETKQFQLRGMAVLSGNQKQGFGSLLVKEAEKVALKQNIELIWFNARENAVDFYKRINYVILGTRFEIEGVGPHFIMFKKLN